MPRVKTLAKRYKLLISAGFVGAFLFLILNILFFPLEYRADAQALIISQSRLGVDPYTAVKSAERVGENLSQIVKTEDFLSKVLTYNASLNQKVELDNLTAREKRELWNKTVYTSVVYGTGVLNVSAFNKDPKVAEEIAAAVVGTLVGRGWEYVGGDVVIKVVNNPVATKFAVRPNLPLNFVLGFLVGTLLMGAIVVRKYS